ncbi:hypothetical protein [Epilithonimonas caeni]|uniref:hypothetical protein n=1 Tax=Epilithonimonas caeni TaxID=365343 RepID=UPI000486DF7B|nr:hypothetical protein [Epilithonimonas caeni]
METKIKKMFVCGIFIFGFCFLKSQILTKDIRNDFCRNAKLNFYYGSDSFRGWMTTSAQRLGYKTPHEIEEAVQKICSNDKLQDEFFKSVDRLGGSREFKEQQYISIGMKPLNAKLLNDYMILKYHTQSEEEIKQLDKKYGIKDTLMFTKAELLKSSFPKSNFINDSLTIVKQYLEDIKSGEQIEINFKTEVLNQYYYLDFWTKKHNLAVIFFSVDEERNIYKLSNIILTEKKREDGDEDYISSGNKRNNVTISKNKFNDYKFISLKEGGNSFLVFKYKNDSDYILEYYNPIDLKLVKTKIENEVVKTNPKSSKNSETIEFPIFTYNTLMNKSYYEDGGSVFPEQFKEYYFLYGIVKKVINNDGGNDYEVQITKTSKEFDSLHSDMDSFINKEIVVNIEPADLYNKNGKIKDGWEGRYDLSFEDYKKLKELLVEGRKIKFSYVEGGGGSLGIATEGMFFFNYIEKID